MMLLAAEGWQPLRWLRRATRLGVSARWLPWSRAASQLATNTRHRTCTTAGAMAALAVLMVSPRAVVAAPRCSALMLSCTFGDVARPVSLSQLAGNDSLRRKVQKGIGKGDCYLVPTSETPFGCDWRSTVRAGTIHVAAARSTPEPSSHHDASYGASTPARPTTGGGAASDGDATARANETTAPAPRRDSAGRFGTTPAPQQPRASVATPDRGPFADHIEAAATRYQLPADLLRAVMQVESGYNPEAQSVKGAIGLMQLLPETGRAMGADDLRDPAQNIPAGARFLRLLANRFGGDLVKVLSAYHAGGTRVLRRDATPFAATDSYVRKVLGVYYALRDG